MQYKPTFIVIFFLLILQSHICFSSEHGQQGYWQRFKNYVAESPIGQWLTMRGKDDAVAHIKDIINKELLKKSRTNKEKLELLTHRDYFIAQFKKAGKTDKELQAQKILIDKAFAQLIDQVETDEFFLDLNESQAKFDESIANLPPEDRAAFERAVKKEEEKIKNMSSEEVDEYFSKMLDNTAIDRAITEAEKTIEDMSPAEILESIGSN